MSNDSKRKAISFLLGSVLNLLLWLESCIDFIYAMVDMMKLRVDFVPRPDDLFAVGYPRSGTTWLLQILHQLTTEGDMNFTHIYEVCPSLDGRIPHRDYEDVPSPRIFRTHQPRPFVLRGSGKYIYIVRNGKDVAVSQFHFFRTYYSFKGTFSEFFDRIFMTKSPRIFGGWFSHVEEWYARRDDPNILFLKYEDLRHDPEGGIRKIIDFCGFEVKPERLPDILERCSFAFMKKHQVKFSPFRPRYPQDQSIRKGQVGGWREHFSPEQNTRFEEEFEKRLSKLGVDLE